MTSFASNVPDALISIGEPYRLEGGSHTVKDVMIDATERLTGIVDQARVLTPLDEHLDDVRVVV